MSDSSAARSERRRPGGLGSALFWACALVAALLAGAGMWVLYAFGRISVEQLLMNLPVGGAAAGGALVRSAILIGILLPVALVALFVFLVGKSLRALREAGLLSGGRTRALQATAWVLAPLMLLGGGSVLGSAIGLPAYLRSVTTPMNLADYYATPEAEAAGAEADPDAQPRNLVIVYLESVEDAFADDDLFEANMLEPVQRATKGWQSIDGLRQYAGGGWTMSGVVSTQCGIPLRSAAAVSEPSSWNSIGGDGERYLPGAVCLGDVLAERGYRGSFIGGADSSFASKGSFLREHGYERVGDLRTWLDAGETETRDWGLSDRRLMAHAKAEVDRLHGGEDPFFMSVLTLDTHESPHRYEHCPLRTEEEMTSITRCSMNEVAAFIDFMDQRGYLEDTAVVVMGDHLKMTGEGVSFSEELRGLSEDRRTVFNRVWSPDGARIARGGVDQFSVYPTLLELAGVDLTEHRAGIGVSALAERVPAGSAPELSADEYEDLVRSRSADFYRELWADGNDVP